MLKKILILPQNLQRSDKIIKNHQILVKKSLLFTGNYKNHQFSTFVIKNQQKMDHFSKTLQILNSMISRLEANTGGQVKVGKIQTKEQKIVEDKSPKIEQEKPAEKKVENKKQNKPAPKKQKKQAEKPGKQPQQDGKVDPKFFSQIDIRIGDLVECWKHPQSQNLYCEKINIGKQVRQIASGLQKFVPYENMKGKVLVMANLKPRPLAGFNSNGMVVCASNSDHTKVELLIPEGQVGERLYLQGHQNLFIGGQILPVLNPKRKVVEKCLQHFTTDAQGYVVWQGIRLRTKAGHIKAATVINGHVG